MIIGTMEYGAGAGAGERVDDRVDIYSFGAILYRMIVAGGWPSARRAYTDLLARMESEPTRVREIDPTVPEAVDQIVSTCLQPDPALRQSTPELLAALEHLDETAFRCPNRRQSGDRGGSGRQPRR